MSDVELAPLISVIVVTYNACAPLLRTLRSLERQQLVAAEQIEVLIIDGLSSDGTTAVAAASPIVSTVVSEPDRGVYDAMNKGSVLAKGEWLHFLNAGDTFHTDHALRNVLMGLEDVGEGSVWAITGAANLQAGRRKPLTIPNVPHVWWRHALGFQPHCHQACWFRRSTFVDCRGFSLDFGTAGDFDLILRFGLFNPPDVIEGLNIDYAGGGMSEISARATARLLHEVRSSRMELGSTLKYVDACIAESVSLVNLIRSRGGRFRLRVQGLGWRRRMVESPR